MKSTGGASTVRAALALGAMMALVPAGTAGAAEQIGTAEDQRFAPGEVLVRYEPGTSAGERAAVRAEADAELERRLELPRAELLSLPPGESVLGALAELRGEPEVAFAEPNYIYELAALPNDLLFADDQWDFDNNGDFGGAIPDADIDATEAWDLAIGNGPDAIPGSPDVVVGVVDSGIVTTHPDLASNIWVNPEEDGLLAGVDDGPNGFVDDVNGWNFVNGNANPMDGEGHGTHVAGTIGAEGNNSLGVAGVNWDVSLMALRACDSVGKCLNEDIVDAFEYAGDNGAQVVNASLSGSGFSSTQAAAVASNPDTLFVVAAGNDGTNNDVLPRSPCNLPGENLICVGSTNDRDNLSGFSNYGASSVDLAAPGGGTPGRAIKSTHMEDIVNQVFASPLSSQWLTGGMPNTWDRTTEPSGLSGGTLTDSPGGDFVPGTNSFARFGPVDLSTKTGCHLRYDLELDLPDDDDLPAPADDLLLVEASTDDVTYSTLEGVIGVGEATRAPSLSFYSGAPAVYVKFRMLSDSDATVGDGAHIDNVRIRCPSEAYRELQGTSMSSPHVAGAAALMLDQNPGATVAELREWLLDGADLKPGLDGLIATGARLNLERSLQGALGADIKRPDTTIVARPPDTSTANTASFSFDSNEPGTFSCSLNGQAYSACAPPHALSGLAIGQHTFRVRATDLNGNTDATPATDLFTVEAAPKAPDQCAALRKKLKRAKSQKQKRKLRKKIKKRCP